MQPISWDVLLTNISVGAARS